MAFKSRFRVPMLAMAAVAAVGLTGYTVTGSRIYWNYFTSSSTNTTGSTTAVTYDSSGLPTIVDFTKTGFRVGGLTAPYLPSSLLSGISVSLPESKDITSNSTFSGKVDVSNSDNLTNVQVSAETDAWVTFISEGASYENSVGFFIYDPTNPPKKPTDLTNDQIILPRAVMDSPLPKATASSGATVYLGKIPAGKALGFFVVANGWSSSGRSNASTGTKAGVNEKQATNAIFYSLKDLNPEPSKCNKSQHAVLLDDRTVNGTTTATGTVEDGKKYRRMILGFEDLLRASSSCGATSNDNDFNDILLALHLRPTAGQDPLSVITNLGSIPSVSGSDGDTDGDGVKDSLDEFPTDATAVSSRWPLGKGALGSLAYEDYWPLKGDYDLNDVVLRYASQEFLHADGKVSRLAVSYRLDARGGAYASGFALTLPGVRADNIASATLSVNSGTATAVLPLSTGKFSAASDATFEIFKDAYAYTTATGTGNCALYFNTHQGCPKQLPTQFVLNVTFKNRIPTSGTGAFPAAPYNPFIFRTANTGIEVHLPGQQPSDRADTSLFKTGDDQTVKGSSNTYMDAKRLPWALHLPIEWAYPEEFIDVARAYSTIVDWAQSGGSSSTSWYTSPTDSTKIYTGN